MELTQRGYLMLSLPCGSETNEGGEMIRMLSAAAKVAAVLFVIDGAGALTVHEVRSALGQFFVAWLLFMAADRSDAKDSHVKFSEADLTVG